MTANETTDPGLKPDDTEHDSASCEHPEVFRLIVTRKSDTDDASVHEVEMGFHVHSRAEARTILEAITEAEARLQAMVLLNQLQRSMPSALLTEMIEQLDAILTGNTEDTEGSDDE
jgi:hypothetical protein